MIVVTLDRPWLWARLAQPMRILSWAPHRAGYTETDRVAWREVRDADLTENFDAITWLAGELDAKEARDSVGLLTSRDLGCHHLAHAEVEGVRAACLATVGLSNAERIGHRQPTKKDGLGTINLLAVTDAPLSDTGLLEALSIATEARTVAVMENGLTLPEGRASGTGTDCIAIAAPAGTIDFAGLHTPVGEALGKAVFEAIVAGAREWMETEGGW